MFDIAVGRNADQRHEQNWRAHTRTISLGEFCNWIESVGESNDCYLLARNALLQNPRLAPLLGEAPCPSGILEPAGLNVQNVEMWLGPSGTTSELHHDPLNILFGQVYGVKEFEMVSPLYLDPLDNGRDYMAKVRPAAGEKLSTLLRDTCPVVEATVRPGDFLFIPVGWWHRVTATEVSISLGYKNFAAPNPVWRWRSATGR